MNPNQRLQLLVEPLRGYVEEILDYILGVESERQAALAATAAFVRQKISRGDLAELVFICTHNSRRSHFSHVWADTAASFYGLASVRSYSGGTEVSACDARTVRALRRAGFSVVILAGKTNPHYLVQAHEHIPPLEIYSKLFSAEGIPTIQFAAMMCCSHVDDTCPTIAGSATRIALHYDDPKVADDTPNEAVRYDERCLQIGRDMFHLMSLVNQAVRA